MDLEDNLSLMDRVKLKRSKSKELRLIQQAMEEEEKVARLKKRLERRRRRAERKNSDQEMIQKRNEQLISECANKSEDFKETVNFNNSGLIHVKCISPVNNVNVASRNSIILNGLHSGRSTSRYPLLACGIPVLNSHSEEKIANIVFAFQVGVIHNNSQEKGITFCG